MKNEKRILEEPAANHQKAEEDLLKKALSNSYTERFHTTARLMKLNIILKSAKINLEKINC